MVTWIHAFLSKSVPVALCGARASSPCLIVSGRGGREKETNGKEKEEEAIVRGKMCPIVYVYQLDCEIQNLAR